jgi:tRNA A37 methylthiotransferase MiaB
LGIGPLRSRPKNEILAQVEKLVEDGAHIIVLTGRDAGSWGTDLNPPQTYLDLLNPILKMPGDFEVYINQFGANWVLRYGEELLKAFLHPKITDIHISIETVSPRLLKLMGRDPRVMEIEPFLKTLREKKPNLILRTDLLIGFPTETEEELQMTIEFARKYFNDIACHAFELHPSTPIAKMGLPFYDEITIERRVQHARMFMEGPEVITHRGGQVYETMIEREKRKEALRHRKSTVKK